MMNILIKKIHKTKTDEEEIMNYKVLNTANNIPPKIFARSMFPQILSRFFVRLKTHGKNIVLKKEEKQFIASQRRPQKFYQLEQICSVLKSNLFENYTYSKVISFVGYLFAVCKLLL